MQTPPPAVLAAFAVLFGYPLIQIVALLASRPLMRRAVGKGESIKARSASGWEAGAVDIALSGANGLPGYLLLPVAMPWHLIMVLAGVAPRGARAGTSEIGRLRDDVILVSLVRWPLTTFLTALVCVPNVAMLVAVLGPAGARSTIHDAVVHLTGTLRLPRPAERVWNALAG